MGRIQDAINQAFGLASPKSDADRGGQDYSKEEAGWLNKWLNKSTRSGQAKGDRYDTRESPYDFYKRQAAAQKRREDEARAKQYRDAEVKRNQGKGGNPTQGKWGGIF